MLQPLPQHLLALWRKAAECGIVLQCAFLLSRRNILVAAQPVAGVTRSGPSLRPMRLLWSILVLRWTILIQRCLPSLHGTEVVALRQAWRDRRHRGRHCQRNLRHPSRHEISPPHSPRPWLVLLTLTDSPAHRAALPGHPANRNLHTDRGSSPKLADRSRQCLGPIGSAIRSARSPCSLDC